MGSKFKGVLLPLALLLPTFVVLGVFIYYTQIQTFILSTYLVAFYGLHTTYVGFENYLRLFSSPGYYNSVRVTLLFSAGVLALSMTTGLGLAMLVNLKIKGARLYRIALIWPYALSPAVAGMLWLHLFSTNSGLVNYLIDSVSGGRPNWTGDGTLALLLVIFTAAWKQLGYNLVFYLAALQNVPGELLEAAKIDGANAFQRFWAVTFKALSPTTFFLLITNLVYAFFDTFGMIDVMTAGGPVDATNVMIYNLYQDGFRNANKTGIASAQSIMLLLLMAVLTWVQFRGQKKWVHYA